MKFSQSYMPGYLKGKLKPEEAKLHAFKIAKGRRYGKRWFPY